MFKKSMAVVMAGMLCFSVMTGCSKKEDLKKKDTKEISNMNKTGLPIVKEKVTLKFIGVPYPQHAKFDDMPFFKQLEEKTNVHIEWDLIPENVYREKKNLLLAADEIPDGFFGSNAFGMDDANKYGPQGTVIPLDDLIDKYAPNYKKDLASMPILNGLTTAFDGKKYTIGNVTESVDRSYPDNLYINKAWIDKLNLKVPTTVDEYYEVLKAFKEKDPNGNHKKDEIPYSFLKFNHIQGYGSFFGAFGRVDVGNGENPTSNDHFVVENGKAIFTADKPEYKDAIKYFSKFFKEGLFDKEGFTQDSKQYGAKAKSPDEMLGSFYGWSAASVVGTEHAKDYIAIAPLKGPNGQEPVVKKRNNNINVQPSGFAITKKNKNPEITMRWIDEFFNEKTGIESHFGPVGITLKETSNGNYDYITPPAGMLLGEFRIKNAPMDVGPKFLTSEIYGKKVPYDSETIEKINVIKDYYLKAKQNDTLPIMNFKPEEIKLNSTVGMDIDNLVRDKQAKWLLEGNIDAGWDDYVSKLKQLRVEDYTKQIQTVYERSVGKK